MAVVSRSIYCNFYLFISLIFSLQCGSAYVGTDNHPAWAFLDSLNCGESVADRIIGGVNAALGQFPWIARLGYTSDYDIEWMCGGALITDRHVVTAAHCTTPPEEYELTIIRLGEHDTETNPDCIMGICAPPVQDIQIKNIFKHADFENPTFHNDIALIELNKPAVLNDYVSPICLPRENSASLKVGERATVAGWGKMNMTTEERATILQMISLPIVPPETCDMSEVGFHVKSSEICAGAQYNKDACGGDSGGPLMKVLDTPEGPKTYLLGVVSFGPTICGIKKPGVYSYVPYFLNWILDRVI